MPSDAVMKMASSVHRGVLRLSRGRVGGRMKSMPVLELTTIGRRSGQRRTSVLTAPVQLGETLVIVASRGGDTRHPDWYFNLEANPAVEVSVSGGPARPMRARIASEAERAELWPRIVTAFSGYDGYRAKTDRVIPVVLLEPVAG